MPSISSLVSIGTGWNSRRPSRVRLRIAVISRSILAIEDLMKPSASVKSCESCRSAPSRAGDRHGGGEHLGAVGLLRALREQAVFLCEHCHGYIANRAGSVDGSSLADQFGCVGLIASFEEGHFLRELG